MNDLSITWLGQSGYIFEYKGQRLVTDPYLSNSLAKRGFNRMIPIPISIEEVRPDYVFCSHDHGDHFDEETIYAIHQHFPYCKIIGPKSVYRHARDLQIPITRLILLEIGQVFNWGELSLTGVKAFHSDPYAIGALIQVSDTSIYFSGDTLYDKTLASRIKEHRTDPIDISIICINGKLMNMNMEEAYQLVQELGSEMVIPMHYGMFAENTVDPEPFFDILKKAGLKTMVFNPGVPITLKGVK